MQELQPINGIVNGGVLLRRTPYVVQPPTQQQAPLQQTALKCPRCDSLNTKFCYYNNYNLSQPRHFCKNCRRYWTKGGVLRNVPVGGGCRKSKRTSSSKSKQPSTNGKKNGHNSAVDGGLVRIPEVDNAVEVNGDGNGNSNSNSNNNSNSNGVSCGGLFSDDIGGLINLISNDNNEVSISVNDGGEAGGGGGGETTSFSEFLQNQDWEMGKIICGVQEEKRTMAVGDEIGDPTVRIEDFLQNRGSNNNNNSSSNVGLSTLDWHLTADNHQGLFDNHTVDHHDYWSQSTSAVHRHHHHDPQWSDSTTTHFPLFLP